MAQAEEIAEVHGSWYLLSNKIQEQKQLMLGILHRTIAELYAEAGGMNNAVRAALEHTPGNSLPLLTKKTSPNIET